MHAITTFSKLVAFVALALALKQTVAYPLRQNNGLAVRDFTDEAAVYERSYDDYSSDLSRRDLKELLNELERRTGAAHGGHGGGGQGGKKPKSKPYVCSHCSATFSNVEQLQVCFWLYLKSRLLKIR